MQTSVVQLVENAAQLDFLDLERLLDKLHELRAKRNAPSIPQKEADLLKKINKGFPTEKWVRLTLLQEKMETADLTEAEAAESLALAEELEAYTVQRFIWLKKLAAMRKISVEKLMEQLEIAPSQHV